MKVNITEEEITEYGITQKGQNGISFRALLSDLGAVTVGENARSRRSNHGVRRYEHGEVLRSYSSIVGVWCRGEYYFGRLHDCSATTKKHVKQWCGLSVDERRAGIKRGEYGLIIDV